MQTQKPGRGTPSASSCAGRSRTSGLASTLDRRKVILTPSLSATHLRVPSASAVNSATAPSYSGEVSRPPVWVFVQSQDSFSPMRYSSPLPPSMPRAITSAPSIPSKDWIASVSIISPSPISSPVQTQYSAAGAVSTGASSEGLPQAAQSRARARASITVRTYLSFFPFMFLSSLFGRLLVSYNLFTSVSRGRCIRDHDIRENNRNFFKKRPIGAQLSIANANQEIKVRKSGHSDPVRTLARESPSNSRPCSSKDGDCHTSDVGHWFAMTLFWNNLRLFSPVFVYFNY